MGNEMPVYVIFLDLVKICSVYTVRVQYPI